MSRAVDGPTAAPNTSVIDTWPSLAGYTKRRNTSPLLMPPPDLDNSSAPTAALSAADWVNGIADNWAETSST